MSKSPGDEQTVYPALKRADIDTMIGALIEVGANDAQFPGATPRSALLSYLLSFYTKRWGLPAVLVREEG